MNIFISSACSNEKKIDQVLEFFLKNKYNKIELTGNLTYNKNYLKILKFYQKKYNFKYLIHNYFPIPKIPFMLNLGSSNKDIQKKSLNNAIKAIKVCHELSIKKISFHAPFLIDFNFKQAGKRITQFEIMEKKKVIQLLKKNLKFLNSIAGNKIKIYLENNVISKINYNSFGRKNFFLFTDSQSFKDLRNEISFRPLIDMGHLKVSSKTLGLNFENEFLDLQKHTDYFHLSDNNGDEDSNKAISKNSNILKLLKNIQYDKKYLTLEVYNSWKKIQNTINNILK
jgi:sugar phosphate isomerase/epimerase